MPATRKITLRMTVRSWRRNAKLSTMSFATVRTTPTPLRSMASRGMRTTVTMSTAETANAAPDTNTTGSMPNRPNSKPPSTGPTRPESALIWLTMAEMCIRDSADPTFSYHYRNTSYGGRTTATYRIGALTLP